MWRLVFQTRQYLKGSLWFLPLLGGLAGAAARVLEARSTARVEAPTSLQYSASTASTLLAAIVGSTAALTGFVVTVSVLVVQMATGTFSARYMRLWYRDRMLHVLLAMLVGTFTFSFTLLAGVEEGSVPNLGITATGVLMAVDLFLFLFFLDRFIHRLRPVAVAALVAGAGRRAFESAVRAAAGPMRPRSCARPFETADEPTLVVREPAGRLDPGARRRRPRSLRARARLHARPDHAVGDFVPEGAAGDPASTAEATSVAPPSGGCAACSRSASSGRSSRIRRSRCGSWSTSRSRRSRRRSTTRPRRCRCSTTSATRCA